MNKKSQITLFIILGLILLGAAVAYYTFSTTRTEKQLEVGQVMTEQVPAELSPLKLHIEDCLEKSLKNAIKRVGDYGGFLDTSQFSPNPYFSTQGNAVPYMPGSEYMIPYWYYMKSDDECMSGCEFSYEMLRPLCRQTTPTGDCFYAGVGSIEEDIDTFVENDVQACFNFQEFENQGFEIEVLQDISVKTQIRDRTSDDLLVPGKASIFAVFPLKITRNSNVQEINYFNAEIPTNFYSLFEAGYDIATYKCMFESHIQRMIDLNSGLGDGDLPPIADANDESVNKIWIKQQVENQVKALTYQQIPQIGVFNSANFVWPFTYCYEDGMNCDENPDCCIRQASADKNVFTPLIKRYPVEVYFRYNPFWRPYFDIKPSEGMVIGPTSIIGVTNNNAFPLNLLSNLVQMKDYQLYYFYSFPVLVELVSNNNFAGRENLRFLVEANLRGNECYSDDSTIAIQSGGGESLFCKSNLKNATITVIDEYNTSKPVAGVSVSASVGSNCFLGYTNQSGALETKVPTAFEGFLTLTQPDYLGQYVLTEEMPSELTVKLKPLQEKNVSIKVINEALRAMQDGMSLWELRRSKKMNTAEPAFNDTIIVQLERIPDDFDTPFQNVISFQKGELIPSTIKLAEGFYEIKIQLFKNDNLTLPEEHNRFCFKNPLGIGQACDKEPVSSTCSPRGDSDSDFENGDCYINGYKCEGNWVGKSCSVDEDVPYEETSLDSYPNGGAEFTNNSGYWNINPNYLNQGDTVTFYLFRLDKPTRHHHINEIDIYKEYSRMNYHQAVPEIK